MLYFKKFFTLFALLSLSMGANASTDHGTISGVLGPDDTSTPAPALLFFNTTFGTGLNLDHFLTFTVNTGGTTSTAGASATSLVISSFIGINNFTFDLTDTSGTSLAGSQSSGGSIEYDSISSGTYRILFTGDTMDTPAGGAVTGVLSLTAVPVPAAAWLFGSAMLGLVGVSRSRKATV